MKSTRLIVLALAAFGLLALAGCSDDDPAAPATSTTLATAEKDAATAIAADLGADDGGLMDQVEDAVAFAGGLGLAAKSGPGTGGCEGLRDAVYDEATGTWTITIERERGVEGEIPYASFSRVMTVRFLDADGQPQQFYVTEGVAAATVEFAILSGEGTHVNRRIEHNLLSLEAAFTVTDADRDTVTVNGTFARSAGTVLTAPRFVRTHDSTLQLELIDVMAPRRADRDLAHAVSGTVTGVYDATITFTRGDDYRETTVHREFTIDLADGEGTMTMEGTRNRYRAHLGTGELIEE